MGQVGDRLIAAVSGRGGNRGIDWHTLGARPLGPREGIRADAAVRAGRAFTLSALTVRPGILSPRPWRRVNPAPPVGCDERDGPVRGPCGNGRGAEGARMARDPGGPVATVSGDASAMSAEPATALAAQGAMAHAPATVSGRRKPKLCPGTQIAARVPKGNPGTVRSQGALQQGSQGDLPDLPGRHRPRVAE